MPVKVKVETELQDVDLYKLWLFKNSIDRYNIEKNKPSHEIFRYPYSINEQKNF